MSPGSGSRALPHDAKVILAGAGQMGGALLSAWLDSGLDPSRLAVLDPYPSDALTTRLGAAGVALNPDQDGFGTADALVLAIKPQTLANAAPALSAVVSSATTIVSVLAGKTLADLRSAFPAAGAIVRAMPNTPAAVRHGITGLTAEARATPAQRALVSALLDAVGTTEWLDDEAMIDVVTAISGSGPAYVFHFAECLAQAGASLGLDPDVAARLARATVEGAGALLAARPQVSPDTLRRNVTSPGGTTAAALAVLMEADALAELVREAATAAHRRAGELAG